ncbi:MAG: hypothetical protein IJ955_06870 [Oscillospiraceae bacterium]|nr:hypothetical protein [Oscillospiraceae bacterium]
MQMTNEEIVRHYRQAKDKKADIGVLADLNMCSKDEIRAILQDAGVDPRCPVKRGAFSNEEALRLYESGLIDAEIGKAVGVSYTIIGIWRKRNGLPTQRERRKQAAQAAKKAAPR